MVLAAEQGLELGRWNPVLGACEEAVPTVRVRAEGGWADAVALGWERAVAWRHPGAEPFSPSDIPISRSGALVRALSSRCPCSWRDTPRVPERQN